MADKHEEEVANDTLKKEEEDQNNEEEQINNKEEQPEKNDANNNEEQNDEDDDNEVNGTGILDLLNIIRQFSLCDTAKKEANKEPICELTLEGIAKQIKEGKAKKIIVMTGAGISVAAGIPDFRSPKTGLYHQLQKYDLPTPESVFEINFFKANPKPFCTLSKELYPDNYKPTKAHYFIRLLHEKGLLLRNFTQNIDTLEREAGIPGEKLVEAHGSFASAHCIGCRQEYSSQFVREKIFSDEIPRCEKCSELVKSDIVFFGESLPSRFFDLLKEDFPKCDLLIIIGTSLRVYPFAGLINSVSDDCPRLLINRERVGVSYDGLRLGSVSNYRDIEQLGDIESIIPQFVELLGWQQEFADLLSSNNNNNNNQSGDTATASKVEEKEKE